eukprot:gb/GFBE01028802.1/.p1 GENE.gb/GFBE01028802.1/~~gb/GFBE01028802.1/.p1  ORF type:complete len:272 (+),score=45.42 gb/GFBE01028802.1/:1-816(+)
MATCSTGRCSMWLLLLVHGLSDSSVETFDRNGLGMFCPPMLGLKDRAGFDRRCFARKAWFRDVANRSSYGIRSLWTASAANTVMAHHAALGHLVETMSQLDCAITFRNCFPGSGQAERAMLGKLCRIFNTQLQTVFTALRAFGFMKEGEDTERRVLFMIGLDQHPCIYDPTAEEIAPSEQEAAHLHKVHRRFEEQAEWIASIESRASAGEVLLMAQRIRDKVVDAAQTIWNMDLDTMERNLNDARNQFVMSQSSPLIQAAVIALRSYSCKL